MSLIKFPVRLISRVNPLNGQQELVNIGMESYAGHNICNFEDYDVKGYNYR